MTNVLNSNNTSAGFKQRLTISVILLNLFIYSLVAATLYQSRAKYDAQTAVSTQNISTLLEHQIKGELSSIDIGLLAVKHEAEHQIKFHKGMKNEGLNSYIKMQHSYLPYVQGIRILDLKGDAILGTGGITPGVTINLADRDYFIYQRDNSKGDVFFSKPILGRVAKTWIIGMSRRINNPDGSFAGVIYASIALDHYINLFSKLKISPKSSITLRDSDMALIARYPVIENTVGSRKVSKELETRIKAGTISETYKARAGIDNVERIITCRTIPGYPFIVIVALAPDEYHQNWQKEAMVLLSMTLCFTIVTIVSRKMLLNRWSREQEIMLDLKTARLALELRSERNRAQAYLDTVETIVLALGTEGRISTINRKGCEVLGYNEEELVGKNWFDCCLPQPEGMETLYPLYLRLMSGEIAQTLEYKENPIITKSGELRHIAWHNSLLRDEQGNITGILSSGDDITDRLKVEEERQQLEKQVLHAQKLESLGVLAGGIAHDFNNILTAIMGNISYAKKGLDESHHANEPLARAEKAVKRAAGLAKQLLVFAKGGDPVKKLISVKQSLTDAVSLVLSGTTVQTVIDLQADLYAVNADEGQISQAFHNIIINAVQAMPDGGRLTVSARNIAITDANSLGLSAGDYVQISFADEGCGIAAENLGRIFDPYFTNKTGGSGLGLASTYAIINKHGGHISVSSPPDKGTTFDIFIPGFVEPPSEELQEAPAPGNAQVVYSVLVMDDDEMVRELAYLTLKRLGYTVACCKNGAEAVSLYRSAEEERVPFSLVIMDLTIPGGMGGVEAARQILSFDPDAQLVVSSGYSEDPVMANFSDYGFCAALEKPYNIEEIARILQGTKRR